VGFVGFLKRGGGGGAGWSEGVLFDVFLPVSDPVRFWSRRRLSSDW